MGRSDVLGRVPNSGEPGRLRSGGNLNLPIESHAGHHVINVGDRVAFARRVFIMFAISINMYVSWRSLSLM